MTAVCADLWLPHKERSKWFDLFGQGENINLLRAGKKNSANMKLLWNFLLSETVESFQLGEMCSFQKVLCSRLWAEACDYYISTYTFFSITVWGHSTLHQLAQKGVQSNFFCCNCDVVVEKWNVVWINFLLMELWRNPEKCVWHMGKDCCQNNP